MFNTFRYKLGNMIARILGYREFPIELNSQQKYWSKKYDSNTIVNLNFGDRIDRELPNWLNKLRGTI